MIPTKTYGPLVDRLVRFEIMKRRDPSAWHANGQGLNRSHVRAVLGVSDRTLNRYASIMKRGEHPAVPLVQAELEYLSIGR